MIKTNNVMTKLNSFMTQFAAAIKGDNVEVQAAKTWRQAESGLKVTIAALEGDVIKLEDNVTNAQENLDGARINNGKSITNREYYIDGLVSAKNVLNAAEKELKAHNAKLDFLKGEYEALKAE